MRHAPTRKEVGLARLGRLVGRRKYVVLAATLALLVGAVLLAGGAVSRLSSGGLTDPAAESSQASDLLEQRFGGGEPNYLLLVTAREGGVDDPDVVAAGTDVADRLAGHDGVERVVSYWAAGSPASLRSKDGTSALVLARLAGDEDEVKDTAGVLTADLAGSTDLLRVQPGGSGEVFRQISASAEEDLKRAERVAFPLTFLALILVFGAVAAAALPVVIGVVSVLGTLLVLAVVTALTDVSVFALNLTTALGLGLAIDYSLFVVSRYREELAAGREPADALAVTVGSAGRTVVFSAVTVALSLSALLVFPLYFLRSFAYAGIPVVLVAAVGAVVVLPALLAVLGRRVDFLSIRRSNRDPARHGRLRLSGWGRVARLSARRPIPVVTASVAVLALLGAPFLQVSFGRTDDRNLPRDSDVAVVHDTLREAFPSRESDPLTVVSRSTVPTADLLPYASELSSLPDVARVDTADGSFVDGLRVTDTGQPALADGKGTWISVVPAVEPYSERGEALVHAVRDLRAPAHVLVGGSAARLVDTKAAVGAALPWALLIIVASVGTLLFAFTGGLLIPIKALVVNVLSLSATFGVLVWGFQEGHLDGIVGDFAVTGMTDLAIIVLMFCVAFGLSMDYEVFLLSRMRDEWERTGDNTAAVVSGIERTGRIVTSAAVLISIVFVSFVTSGIASLKMLGVGLTVAVVVDATLVRAFLVPAAMRLAGPANWWAPAPLRRLYQRFGLREEPGAGGSRPAPERDGLATDPAWLAALGAGTRQPVGAGARD